MWFSEDSSRRSSRAEPSHARAAAGKGARSRGSAMATCRPGSCSLPVAPLTGNGPETDRDRGTVRMGGASDVLPVIGSQRHWSAQVSTTRGVPQAHSALKHPVLFYEKVGEKVDKV